MALVIAAKESKVVIITIQGKPAKRGKEASKGGRVNLGTKVELNNGNIVLIDGKAFLGQGTIVFFSKIHGTVSVQHPSYVKETRGKFETETTPTTEDGKTFFKPVWTEGPKTSGMSLANFTKRYGFAQLAIAAKNKAEADHAAEQAARKAA